MINKCIKKVLNEKMIKKIPNLDLNQDQQILNQSYIIKLQKFLS